MALPYAPEAAAASFRDLPVSQQIRTAIAELGWQTPTPIQSLALPALLAGEDVVGLAQTGSGKTAAFVIPMLEQLQPVGAGVQALVLVPTRELAAQVATEVGHLARHKQVRTVLLCGGLPMGPQVRGLRNRAQVVVGTPGRVLDHLGQGTLRLDSVRYLVLDEADRMLDMGFAPDVQRILSHTPASRQAGLFSATMPAPIREIVNRFMRSPRTLAVQPEPRTVDTVDQVYYHVADRDKTLGLRSVLDAEQNPLALVFRRTKHSATKLHRQLERSGYRAGLLHGGMTQGQRTRSLAAFRRGDIRVLVTTNVVARGIDIPDVSHVVNYDLPEDVETYVHRVGRTARAGKSGTAITLVGESDIRAFREMQRSLPAKAREERLPIYS